MRAKLALVTVLLIATAFAGTVHGQSRAGTIYGTVLDAYYEAWGWTGAGTVA